MQAGKVDRENISSHGGWQNGQVQNFLYMYQVDDDCMHVGAGFKLRPFEPYSIRRSDLCDKTELEHWG
eukprot:2155887-Rhodomonas_salina.1